eukprot:2171221-Rhodomonas_salina.1
MSGTALCSAGSTGAEALLVLLSDTGPGSAGPNLGHSGALSLSEGQVPSLSYAMSGTRIAYARCLYSMSGTFIACAHSLCAMSGTHIPYANRLCYRPTGHWYSRIVYWYAIILREYGTDLGYAATRSVQRSRSGWTWLMGR